MHDLYAMNAYDMQQRFCLTSQTAQKVVSGLSTRLLLEQELSLLEKHQFGLITLFDDEYPALLKTIHLPPPILYIQGAPLPKSDPSIAVIGSRAASEYGKRVINSFVPQLVAQGFTIVSGGALGADSMAHKATLDAGGKTIAILGSGLLRPYPALNKRLFEHIIAQGGTLVSPFFLRMDPFPGNFPARNRIIAGLSHATIVVQAALESGARITASLALEQGRDVFAVPGPLDDPLSAGCNALIGQGAYILTGMDDIMAQAAHYGLPEQIKPEAAPILKECNATIPFEAAQPKPKKPIRAMPVPSGPIGIILSACHIPTGFDELIAHTGLGLGELNACLFSMQIEGLIKQNAAGMWEKSF